MSIDLNFWNYKKDNDSDHAAVYQAACCNQQVLEELELLPTEDILKEVSAAFHDWIMLDPLHYESKKAQGSFQIQATSQAVRFDCYSMEQTDMKRFSSLMAKFSCPLYDPQQGVRFDKMDVFLIDEAGAYQTQAVEELTRLLPRLEMAVHVVNWDDYTSLSQASRHIKYDAGIHRAKSLTKVTSFMRFGNAWANRPCQCKTAQLTGSDNAGQLLAELLQKSIQRVVQDFFDRTYYA